MPVLHQPAIRGAVVTSMHACPHRRGTRRRGSFTCRICNPPESPRWASPAPFYLLRDLYATGERAA